MMGRQTGDQSQLFYLFKLEELIPASHLLRRINPVVTRVLAELRENLTPFYGDIGRPSRARTSAGTGSAAQIVPKTWVTTWCQRVVEGLQGLLLQVEVSNRQRNDQDGFAPNICSSLPCWLAAE